MTLAPGTRVGPCEVLGPLGAGGMGDVYRARDTRLGRDVALKVLSGPFAADPDWLARFESEARTLAALNHQNIAQIFGVVDVPPETGGAGAALVMELVEGEDLAQRIARGPMPPDEVREVARQIAEALEAAHELGIVHRDLKPANIRVRPDGTVKVLDFGLAKALTPASASVSSDAATLATPARTVEGVIIGTAAYMAPEQARGKPVDRRADIWAFGVVLWEMLSGRRPFEGETMSDTISLVLTQPLPFDQLPRDVPPALRLLLQRCLERNPRQRLRDIGEARLMLEAPGSIPAGPFGRPRSAARRAGTVAAAAALLVAGWGVGWWMKGGAAADAAPPPTFVQLTDQAGEETAPSLAPDGMTFAYASRTRGTWDIYVQRIGGRTPILVAGDDARDENAPAFSPDGLRLAYHESDADGGIFVVGATGESARRITEFGFHPSWSPDGARLVFCTEEITVPHARHSVSALWVVDLSDGAVRRLYEGDAVQPAWSPSGGRVAFWMNDSGQRDLFTISADGGRAEPVLRDAALDWSPAWSPDGRFLYFASERGGAMNLWRIAIDEGTGRALGTPEPVTSGVHAEAELPSLSRDGTKLLFRAQVRAVNPLAFPFDPTTETLGEPRRLLDGTGILAPTSVSPDGRSLLLTSQGSRQDDIFLSAIDGSGLRRLTDGPHRDRWPRWLTNDLIVFYSNRSGQYEMWSIKRDGSGLRRLSDEPGVDLLFPAVSPDGTRLVANSGVSRRAWLADLTKPWRPDGARLLEGLGTDDEWLVPMSWSPDDRRLAGAMMSRSGRITGFGVYDLDTGALRRVSDLGRSYGVAWLPDSRRVIQEDGGERLRLFDVDTARHHVLLDRGSHRFFSHVPAIAPDGRTIYLGGVDIQSDVWMLERR